MDTINNENKSHVYDPSIVGLPASKYKTISGTPSAATGDLNFNSSEICGLAYYKFLDIAFYLTIPTAPTAGHSRAWGLKSLAGGNKGRIEFVVDGADFKATAYDNDGTEIDTVIIPWDSDWTNENIEYKIRWTDGVIQFYVNGYCYAKMALTQEDGNVRPPSLPLCEHLLDAVGDSPLLDRTVFNNIRHMI